MLSSRLALVRKRTLPESVSASGEVSFWESHFLPQWLPILLGLVLGTASAFVISEQAWVLLIPLALIVPVSIVFIRYPFVAPMLWILAFPYIVRTPEFGGRVMYNLLHRAIIPSALVIVILSGWLRIQKREPVRFGRAELVMLCLLGWGLANIILLSPDPSHSIIRFYDRLFVPFCMYWLIRLITPTDRDLRRFLVVAFITVIIQCTIGLISTFSPQSVPHQWLGEAGERTTGTFGNPAVYSSTLIFLALFLLQYVMQGRSRRIGTLFILTFGLVYLCVFFSFSRGSWLGGLLVLMGLLFLYPKTIVRLAAVGLTAMIILGSTVFASQLAFAWERLNAVQTVEGRVLGGAKSVQMIERKPFSGWGYDTYDLYDEQFKTRVANLATDQQKTSHNTFLTLMAEQGVPALVLYILPVAWWLELSRKVWRRLPERGFQNWCWLVMLWLLILDHLTVSSFMDMIRFNLFGTTVFWMALGLIASLVSSYLDPSDLAVPKWLVTR
jgi:O-antigen ligase